jgi:putative addiction module component (TIGR02574 family)
MTQVSLPLQKMSVPEKLDVIERVWASLRDRDEVLESPTWHKSLLAERKKLHAEGKAKFSPWSEAKNRIRRKVRAS